MSYILKFITFTLEVKRRLWSALHPEAVLQRFHYEKTNRMFMSRRNVSV